MRSISACLLSGISVLTARGEDYDKILGLETALTRTELRILEYLMKSPGRIYTKQQIFSYAWKDAYENEDTVDENSFMVHISNLRGKIEDDPKNPKILKTIKGLGYKLKKEKKDE